MFALIVRRHQDDTLFVARKARYDHDMALLLMIVVLLALVFGPGLWVRRVIERYSKPADRYAGTGAQLARYLLDKLGMQHVTVETTDQGDHYDPAAKAVRLTLDKYEGRSLTAITVAAHEVGHAQQDAEGTVAMRARAFLVTAEEGSLSGAARALGLALGAATAHADGEPVDGFPAGHLVVLLWMKLKVEAVAILGKRQHAGVSFMRAQDCSNRRTG